MRMTFRFRVFMNILLLVCVICFSFGALYALRQRSVLEEELAKYGRTASSVLASNLRLGLLTGSTDFLSEPINGMLAQDNVLQIVVYNKEGSMIRIAGRQDLKGLGKPRDVIRLLESNRSFAHYGSFSHDEFWAPVFYRKSRIVYDDGLFPEPGEKEVLLGAVKLSLSRKDILAGTRHIVAGTLILLVTALVLGGATSYFIAARVTNPLTKFIGEIRSMGRHGIKKLSPGGDAELAGLADTFNFMADSLKSREEERRETAEGLEWESRVNEVAADISRAFLSPTTPSLEDFSSLLFTYAKKLTDSESGFISYLDRKTGCPVSQTQLKETRDINVPGVDSDHSGKPSGLPPWAAAASGPFLVNTPPEVPGGPAPSLAGVPVRRYIAAPAMMGDRAVGYLAVCNAGREYAQRDLRLIERLTNLYAIAIHRKWNEATLHESEERLRTIVNNAPVVLYALDDKGVFTMSEGRGLEKAFRSNELVGHSALDVFGSTPLEEGGNNVSAADVLGRAMAGETITFVSRVGGICFDNRLIPIRGPNNGVVTLIGVAMNITDRKKAEEELQEYQARLRSLASQLSLAEERERRRIASELHDHIGQILAVTKIKLGAVRECVEDTRLMAEVEGIRALIEQSIKYTRSLTCELSPPILYEVGFEAAVEWLGEQIQKQHGVMFFFDDDGQTKPLTDETRILLFQSVRELLVNVVKHSGANRVLVSLKRGEETLRVMVEDNGIGMGPSGTDVCVRETNRFGLFNIRERLRHAGGEFSMDSRLGRGTRVTLVAPTKKMQTGVKT